MSTVTGLTLAPRRDILLISTADWDNPYRTNKQIVAEQFARRGYRVLYVDSLGLRRPALKSGDLGRMGKRLLRAARIGRKALENLWVSSPLCLPGAGSSLLRAASGRLLLAQIRACMRRLDMRRPLVWTYNPTVCRLIDALPHAGVVYHCVDDLGASPGIDAEAIRRGEHELGRRAGLCFATSRPLEKRMRKIFPEVVYEPNGCDSAFFGTTGMAARVPAPALDAIAHPRLLFVGALSDYKVDFALLRELAEKRPDWNWILVGRHGEGQPWSSPVPDLPNVHALGGCLHGQLPYVINKCDAAALPIPHNEYTDAMFPMKFFEFLAAGIPVVCTRLPALEEFEDLYFACEGADGFLAAIEKILSGGRRDAGAIGAACRHNSLEARFARMEKALDEFLPQ